MYAKDVYHEIDYDNEVGETYSNSVQLLRNYVDRGVSILDYGCGTGGFLEALYKYGFTPSGVEFDQSVAVSASNNGLFNVYTVDDFYKNCVGRSFDAIHLGDVLEHIPYPIDLIEKILPSLKSGGIFFIEGPLEKNPSLVYWISKTYGWLKHIGKPNFIATDPPHHLFRTSERQQLEFFNEFNDLQLEYWRVYESGWPYIEGGLIKRIIAKIAILMGEKKIGKITFGNRFQIILSKK